jgi:hypothetical protein
LLLLVVCSVPAVPQQRPGYYTPVQPQPYQRKCGTIATDVCPSDVSVPAGATGEQLYTLAQHAEKAGRKSDAEGYLIKSAEMGYVRAEAALGLQYADGRGMPHDDAKALQYLNAAAKQGSAGAESKLGDMYDKGEGVARDPAAALRYYQAAAQQHNSSAEFNLGLKYEFGDGVAHNRATAIQYLRRASVDGHEDSMAQLADALAKAPASKEFHSLDDISAYLHPAVHMKAGACGAVPTLSPILNGQGFSIWGARIRTSMCRGCSIAIRPRRGLRGQAASGISSVQTRNPSRTFGPKVIVRATSAASRPRAISTRPTRGALLRASKVYQAPPM